MLQSLTSAVVVQDTASMHALGVRLAAMFVPGDVIALEGVMGAGKTTLVQGIAWGLGLPQDQYAQSPSYAVAISYPTTPVLHHLDLYRFLENINIADIDAYLSSTDVTIVEWPQALYEHKEIVKYTISIEMLNFENAAERPCMRTVSVYDYSTMSYLDLKGIV